MHPPRDDVVAREEIFDGTMQQLFAFVSAELSSEEHEKCVGDILQSIPAPYFELYLLYRHHCGHSTSTTHTAYTGPERELQAMKAVSSYLDWRANLQLQFNPMHAHEVLGGSVGALEMYRLMPECALGHDKVGQPVVYFLWSRVQPDDVNNMAKIMQRVSTKNIFDYHLWQHEALVELCYHRSRMASTVISSCLLVLDLDQLTTENASAEFLHIASRRADLLNQYFPYLVSKILVINAIETDLRLIHQVRALCSVISSSAVVFFSNSDKDPTELLSQHIEMNELPSEYGGSHLYSLATLPHPFWETEQLRGTGGASGSGGGGRVSPLLSLHLSLPAASTSVPLPPPLVPNVHNHVNAYGSSTRTTEASSATLLQHVDEEDSLYAPPSYLASVDSQSSRLYYNIDIVPLLIAIYHVC